MPEPEAPTETNDQTAWRIARWWKKTREDHGKPIIARGSRNAIKDRDRVIYPLQKLIFGALEAGYTESEVTQTLERCNEGVPSGTAFDKAIGRIRDAASAGSSMMPFNPSYASDRPGYGAPAPRSPADQRLADAVPLYEKYKRQELEHETARG